MSGYTYAPDKPDWDRTAYEDLKASIKAFCLREVLRKTEEGKVFQRINEQIDHFAQDLLEMEQICKSGRERYTPWRTTWSAP